MAGSSRTGSYNRRLLDQAADLLPDGTTLTVWDSLATLPHFDEDTEHAPAAAVVDFRRAIAAADGLLIATPDYNGSFPGVVKNAIDWASRPHRAHALHGKPVAVMGTSPGPGGARAAVNAARSVLERVGAVVTGTEALPFAAKQFGDDGTLHDPATRARLRTLLDDLRASAAPAQDGAQPEARAA